jgi:hypothetical protein
MDKRQVVFVVLLVSCGSYGQERSAQLQEILSKVKNPPPYQCDEVVTSYIVGKTVPKSYGSASKIWRKERYDKIVSDAFIIIVRPDGTYTYMKDQDRYYKRPTQPGAPGTELDFLADDKDSKLTLLGDEVIDGKICNVLLGPPITDEKTGFVLTSKYWIWKDNGVLVKEEKKGQNKKGTTSIMDIEVKNFKLGDIPDSVFAVPKEKIIQTPDAKH